MDNKTQDNKSKLMDEILSIPIELILKHLGISFSKNGKFLKLAEGNRITGGWVANTLKNNVYDYSESGRPQGNIYSFVRDYINLKNKEIDEKKKNSNAIKFFEDFKKGLNHYEGILLDVSKREILNEQIKEEREKNVQEMLEIFNGMKINKDEISLYLKKRGIDINDVPENVINEIRSGYLFFNGVIYEDKLFIPTKTLINDNGEIKSKQIGLKARAMMNKEVPEDKKSVAMKDSFMGFFFNDEIIKTQNLKTLFICEGEIDGLSLFAGGYKNVVWNLGGVGFTDEKMNEVFRKFENIIIAYDDDGINKYGKNPGLEGIKKMVQSIGFDKKYIILDYNIIKKELGIVNNKEYSQKKLDINDLYKELKGDKKVFRDILYKSFKLFDKNELLKEIKEKEKNLKFKNI